MTAGKESRMNDDWRPLAKTRFEQMVEQEMNRARMFNTFLDSLSKPVRDTKEEGGGR